VRPTQRTFISITSEGGLLPTDFLQELVSPKPTVEGLAPTAFHLAEGEKLNEAVTRSWSRLKGCWENFKNATAGKTPAESTTTETRDRWLLPIFQELGFGRLKTTAAIEIEGKSYPLSHRWENIPIHLVGSTVALDTRTARVAGAATASPHSMVQQLLNRREDFLWAILSNGETLRLLRDNIALTRQSYVEFDLKAMFGGDLYADFFLFWLLCHQSRFEGDRPEACWLEKWKKAAEQKGRRALQDMRPNVAKAIAALGQGLISHRKNQLLRDKLHSGQLGRQSLYEQILRVVYRMLFIITAEDRDLLHPPEPRPGVPPAASPGVPPANPHPTAEAKDRYHRFYSLSRLRELPPFRSGTAHEDLWIAFRLVAEKLGSDEGCPELALPPLGSFLWSKLATPDLDQAALANRDFLEAFRDIAFVQDRGVRRMVDYKNRGCEELGAIYESLLELQPEVNPVAGTFELKTAAGNARKTTGSYYTDESLVQCLLDSALDPVLREHERDFANLGFKSAEEAILALKVCDMAVGSGHFLISAAHRLARRLATIRTGEEEPAPAAMRTAVRDVIGRCLYGVDINPMAVELCKFNLWLEALEPGKPLTFLDHHIRCGNSLLGTTPDLVARGIPDEAFDPAEGNDKKACRELKRRNAREREGLGPLFLKEDQATQQQLQAAAVAIDSIPDDRPQDIHRKEDAFRQTQNYDFHKRKHLYDTWCAAFLVSKTFEPGTTEPIGITQRHLNELAQGSALPYHFDAEVERLASQYNLFHWHLVFPDVFRNGGFDVDLGNPPWIRQEMLTSIKRLLPAFRSFASTADSSVYFLERSLQTTRLSGRVALLTPNKWFRASYAERLRNFLRQRCRVALLIDFGHSRNLFPDADTFPAAVVFQPVDIPVSDSETARFVHAHDSDRDQQPLPELIRTRAVLVPHGNLRPDRWHLEGSEASNLLDRLMTTGRPLEPLLRRSILTGLKTGFNEAFYVESPSRNAMLTADPTSEPLFKKFLRGRDVKRWVSVWEDQWHIVIPSSQNRLWPWSKAASEAEAETIFAATHPSVHAHLKHFEKALRARQDKGEYWWELRACDYYSDFDQPKIIVQCIAYYSQFAFDDRAHYVNNKAIVIPTDDLYLLAILNSRIIWWIVNRTFQHMKDEGLSVDVQFLKRLPVPAVDDDTRATIAQLAHDLTTAPVSPTPGNRIAPMEIRLNGLVEQAFALTDAERQVLVSSLPPRDPIAVLESK
jgi:hypothetical protein